MKEKKLLKRVSIFLAVLFFILSIPLAQAMFGEDQITWDRIEGVIVPGTVFGGPNVVAGIDSVIFSWTARRGNARVRLNRDHIRFKVEGLVLAAQNNAGIDLVIGAPSPAVTMVKGTLVCNADGVAPPEDIYDTDPVPLSPQGDASFSGTVGSLPGSCPNAAFLIRVANDTPPPIPVNIKNLWIANGAGRTP